jgi:hypothetical protein
MKPKNIPKPHQRERRREAHHDHDDDEPQHQEPEGRIGHVFSSPPMPALARGFVDLLRALDRDLARFLVDIFAVRELLLDNVDFRHVLEPARPCSGLEADDTAHISAMPCSITSAPAIGITVLK